MLYECFFYFLSNFYTYTQREVVPELFYPGMFVEIQGKISESPIIIPTLFHATHYEEMTRICDGKQAVFKGNKKQWRETGNPNKASYLVNHTEGSCDRICPLDDQCLPGNLVWFGTAREEGEIYGPCQFSFDYKQVLQAYQASRGVDHMICYRVGGTLVYQKEISHVVIVCCANDDCYKLFPLIEEDKTTTKFFMLSSSSNLPRILINSYPLYDSRDKWARRHEHVSLAFYLPDNNACLKLANEVGYSVLKRITHNYCVKSKNRKGEPGCKFAVDPSRIDEKISAKWDRWRQEQSRKF